MTYENLMAWFVPALLTIAVGVLAWMASEISEMSESLAVAVYKIDDHEARLDVLEHRYIEAIIQYSKPSK